MPSSRSVGDVNVNDGWSRREVIRRALIGAGAAHAGWLLAGCGTDEGAAPPRATTTVPGSTVPVDPSTPWWLQADYAPVAEEVTAEALDIRGALPPSLSGLYVKNTSNPQSGSSPHWFFGDGMVHGVRLSGGRADWYRNRYVRTDPYRDGRSFGTGVPGGGNNQSNVSAIWHGQRLLTSGEVGSPFELDPVDLSTRGVFDFGGKLTSAFTAHPTIDPVTGRMHSFGYGFADPYLTYHITEADGTMSHVEAIDLPRSTMMHDFAITETDAIFWDLPVVFHMDLAVQMIQDPSSGIMPFVWEPDAGARIGIMPLDGGADRITWHDIDPCYVFHGVNAYRSGDEVIMDVCRMESVFDPKVTYAGLAGPATHRRWTVNTATGRVSDDVLEADHPGDLPGRDPRRVGREHRYGYLVGTRRATDTVDLGGIIKFDYRRGRQETWEPGSTRHAGEPLFVPGDPKDLGDDAGWLLTFVHDESAGETVLAVLDASDVPAGPVAEVVMPQRVPYGFHATWIPESDLTDQA